MKTLSKASFTVYLVLALSPSSTSAQRGEKLGGGFERANIAIPPLNDAVALASDQLRGMNQQVDSLVAEVYELRQQILNVKGEKMKLRPRKYEVVENAMMRLVDKDLDLDEAGSSFSRDKGDDQAASIRDEGEELASTILGLESQVGDKLAEIEALRATMKVSERTAKSSLGQWDNLEGELTK
mmetsp:Transcript_21785/g.40990  ORF Transcript_21785/g.40990 Transcript_21785/m.40990 type:complete len:183 (+) Transcript_21785:69-617(+)|eukprot:CAMPEP_0182497906 /NCGR_PEP_ID=MMETSP1321-20130603/6278_1 /TAXON_ID=91990 /ORGANISM="Bolidomonas sp., Strain RCC1657" /LENGTH=182 /DNA_ID=CAMNT_0024701885 /DNA_START=70 /DNA_END=618 /DNA_ORIENTATION=+